MSVIGAIILATRTAAHDVAAQIRQKATCKRTATRLAPSTFAIASSGVAHFT
ncbi:hypothetical protein PF005_g26405 [Phytophthora fragariae]|uniref:Uncharacterized protein n=2 Tax=Phytophthora TaxID=4783 RepID=A0A6A3R0C4_9STRA|nr:hypothetical protein PF003_g39593 [Phytophthora fragariae]KAE9037471.1 hypothetical protein PR001_g8360 [Phytophthora rubi]KAE8899107.1 hypothetical protein PF003_g16887 [Phytophthora fragariae]KAE8922839.1 hypothetical protein PF009_g26900 [Phytophthora fragariae]KAE8973593.1 hypothetical protein PF011_g25189 [Phytophthora fragariae]